MRVIVDRHLLVMLIETFEEFLEKRGVDIPNEEKKESEDPCTIYGTDFSELEDELEATLDAFDICSERYYDSPNLTAGHDPIRKLEE